MRAYYKQTKQNTSRLPRKGEGELPKKMTQTQSWNVTNFCKGYISFGQRTELFKLIAVDFSVALLGFFKCTMKSL